MLAVRGIWAVGSYCEPRQAAFMPQPAGTSNPAGALSLLVHLVALANPDEGTGGTVVGRVEGFAVATAPGHICADAGHALVAAPGTVARGAETQAAAL